jgi:2-amino-4-hydroxy-6-hydroxymethyldihydropteridine diphosphokinase
MNECIIGIGSNIDAENNISKMLVLLKKKVKVLKVSTFIKTSPIGIAEQPDFTNGAVKVETNLDKNELKKFLKEIENEMGRDRTAPKFGPRCIDLDIITWNRKIIDEDYYSRNFLRNAVDEVWE